VHCAINGRYRLVYVGTTPHYAKRKRKIVKDLRPFGEQRDHMAGIFPVI
jgi:hypothetical protein